MGNTSDPAVQRAWPDVESDPHPSRIVVPPIVGIGGFDWSRQGPEPDGTLYTADQRRFYYLLYEYFRIEAQLSEMNNEDLNARQTLVYIGAFAVHTMWAVRSWTKNETHDGFIDHLRRRFRLTDEMVHNYYGWVHLESVPKRVPSGPEFRAEQFENALGWYFRAERHLERYGSGDETEREIRVCLRRMQDSRLDDAIHREFVAHLLRRFPALEQRIVKEWYTVAPPARFITNSTGNPWSKWAPPPMPSNAELESDFDEVVLRYLELEGDTRFNIYIYIHLLRFMNRNVLFDPLHRFFVNLVRLRILTAMRKSPKFKEAVLARSLRDPSIQFDQNDPDNFFRVHYGPLLRAEESISIANEWQAILYGFIKAEHERVANLRVAGTENRSLSDQYKDLEEMMMQHPKRDTDVGRALLVRIKHLRRLTLGNSFD